MLTVHLPPLGKAAGERGGAGPSATSADGSVSKPLEKPYPPCHFPPDGWWTTLENVVGAWINGRPIEPTCRAHKRNQTFDGHELFMRRTARARPAPTCSSPDVCVHGPSGNVATLPRNMGSFDNSLFLFPPFLSATPQHELREVPCCNNGVAVTKLKKRMQGSSLFQIVRLYAHKKKGAFKLLFRIAPDRTTYLAHWR